MFIMQDYRIDYERDTMYSKLDPLLCILEQCMGLFDEEQEDEAKVSFDKFVQGLRHAKGEKFPSRLPMLTELSNVFQFTIPERD